MLHKQIGELSGGRDHQTVATSVNRIACMTSSPQPTPPSTAIDGPMVPAEGAGCTCADQRLARLIELADMRAAEKLRTQDFVRRAAREAGCFDSMGDRDALAMHGRAA